MKTLKDIATEMLFNNAATVDFQNYGWQLRKGKGLSDLVMAARKALRTPPFKTERHISLMEDYLCDILKKAKSK